MTDTVNRQEPATLTVEQAAEMLGVSRNSAYAGVARGELPVIRVGKRLLIPRAALQRKLEGIPDEL